MNQKTLGHAVIYDLPQPYNNGRVIVYGDNQMCWYDYVIVGSDGLTESRSNLQYGAAEVALRDALIEASQH